MNTSLRNDLPELRRGWHPVLRVSDLGDSPVRVELLGEAWVVTRLEGNITAFPDRCPHRNARLSDGKVVDGRLQCPYHGWQFSGDGQCMFIPALGEGATVPPTAQLTSAAHVKVQYDLVWIAPEEPVRDILDIPDWDDASLRRVWLPPVVMNATAPQFVDNFLDFGHFPFVHAGTFGAGEDAGIPPYDVQTSDDGWGFVVDYHHQINNKEDPKVATGEHPLLQPRQMRYEFSAPFTVTLRLVLPVAGTVNHLINFIQPLDANRTCVYTLMLRNDCPTDELAQAAIDYELDVLKEDLRIIEHLWDNVVPLEVGQAHTRADRNTVEFRRIMKRLLNLSQ